MPTAIDQMNNVNVKLKANVYFDGKVISHAITAADGTRRTVGVIQPGSFHFTTDAPERMDIIAGECRVQLAGETKWRTYQAGDTFHVPGKSAFDIAVDKGLAEYLCTFEK